MKRREFIALLGGGAAVWSFAARAQQNGLPRVAALMAFKEDDPEEQLRVNALREGLQALGWRERTNIQIDWRFAAGDLTLMQRYASELVNLNQLSSLQRIRLLRRRFFAKHAKYLLYLSQWVIRLEVVSLQALRDLVAVLRASQTMILRSVENGWLC